MLSRSSIFTTQFARLLSTTSLVMGSSKSNLAKLRKKTGYPFGNCKKALEMSNNDLEKAEKWLEEQAKALGWSKAMKMENRNTPQGLVGIAFDKQYAALVEVNCETDFVAKNDKFHRLVDLVAKTCLQHSKTDNPSPTSIHKVYLEGDLVNQLLAADQQSVQDHVVRNVGVVGERLVVRRAALVSVPSPSQLVALTHPASATNVSTLLGKYGAVLIYSDDANHNKSIQTAKQLCQHVIGMNPSRIDAHPDEPHPVVKEKKPEAPTADGEEEGEESLVVDAAEDEETVMMRQAFLLDPDRKVADVVAEAGINILDYVRFECGEPVSSDTEEVTTQAAQAGG